MVFRRSRIFGSSPELRNRPCTLPASVVPVRSNRKMSRTSMRSSFTPRTSAMLTILREPSCKRLTCTTILIAPASCCRITREGICDVGHQHHGFQARERVARRVGVDRAHRSLDAGVHGLQHVERFGAAALADDDAVRTHAQSGAQQLPLADAAFFVQIRRTRFELHDVALLQLQLGGVFDGDDALLFGNEARERVERGGLAGTGSAGNQNGGLRLRRTPPETAACRASAVLLASISSDVMTWRPKRRMVSARPIERQRRNDGVHARAVEQPRVDDGLRFVDAPAHLRHDLFDDVQQVRVVLEPHRGQRELAAALDVDLVEAVDQDVGDRRLLEQRFERARGRALRRALPR